MDDLKCIAVFALEGRDRTGNGKPLMLQNVLFCPVLNWCMRAWVKKGVRRFFVVCEEEFIREAEACFPEGAAAAAGDEETYRRSIGEFARGCLVEEVRDAMLPVGNMMLSFHTPEELGRLRRAVREDIALYHQSTGVELLDPERTYIDPRVTIGRGTLVLPGTILRGRTVVGEGCEIGPDALLEDSEVGDGSVVNASQVYGSVLGRRVEVGPYAHIREGCRVGDGCKVGAFVQIKNAAFGEGTKMAHLTYVGDADVGSHVNFGCGAVTSNYDGFRKYRTTVGDGAFIGCNANLIAPVEVGGGAYIAAGATVNRDVPADALAIGRARQENKPDWARRRREMHAPGGEK